MSFSGFLGLWASVKACGIDCANPVMWSILAAWFLLGVGVGAWRGWLDPWPAGPKAGAAIGALLGMAWVAVALAVVGVLWLLVRYLVGAK